MRLGDRPTRWLFVVLLAGLLIDGARAQTDDEEEPPPTKTIYQYTDDQGQLFFVDDLQLVPPQYRDERHLRAVAEQPVVPAEERESVYDSLQPRIEPRDPGDELPEQTTEPARTPIGAAERTLELTTRRDELRAQLALLEEGYLEPEGDPLAPDELERLLNQTLEALRRVDEQLQRLADGAPAAEVEVPAMPGAGRVRMELLDGEPADD